MPTWRAKIAKLEPEKMQVFGWLYVCVDAQGQRVIDHSGEWVAPETMARAAAKFVLDSRAMSADHARACKACDWEGTAADTGAKNLCPACGAPAGFLQFGRLIESAFFSPEKCAAMGITCPMPTGWWVGFQVDDPAVWARVKAGELTSFSVGYWLTGGPDAAA